MDGRIGLGDDYASLLDARSNGKHAYASPNEKIARILDKGRYSFDDVVEILARVMASRYCFDSIDARGAIGLFADKLLQMVSEEENDEDGEMVDRIDAGGW